MNNFKAFSKEEIYNDRKDKFLKIGRDKGFTKSSNLSDQGLGYKEPFVARIKRNLVQNKLVFFGIILVFLAGIIAIFN